jgi:hypothetical protein
MRRFPTSPSFRSRTLILALAVSPVALAWGCSSTPAPSSASPSETVTAVAPQALSGDWMLETRVGDQSREGRLHFSVTNGVLAGSVYDADGNSNEMKNIVIRGDRISWEAGSQKYEGTAGSLAMKGTVTRAARREGRKGGGEDDSGSGGPPPGRGGGYGRGGRGGRGGARGGSSTAKATWSAYKSVPSPTPTPSQPPAPDR